MNKVKRISKLISTFINRFLDLIYPRYCVICFKNIIDLDLWYLCGECREKIEVIGNDVCLKCGMPQGAFIGKLKECSYCHRKNFSFREVVVCAKYTGIMEELIKKFKFSKYKFLATNLGKLLAERLKEREFISSVDYIVPVPLHHSDLRERNFNQSDLIARVISKELNIPCRSDILIKFRKTKKQVGLGYEERKTNLNGAFQVVSNEVVKTKNILVVDDVFTTGSTVQEITRTLHKAGAKKVYVAVLARAVHT